jgi:c-di-GMP-binding flagellar brake protein YcgR
MRYSKYFKSEQKIFLRSLTADATSGRLDALTVYFHEEHGDYFDLLLPYQTREEENFPFSPEMPFEILSDAMGLGVRLTGNFVEQRRQDLIRLRMNNDLQIFQRRLASRLDVTVGLRYTKIPPFPRTRVNLSNGGIRFQIKPPIRIADLCLLLLKLEENEAPLCALAEVVWLDEEEVQGRRCAGMQFLSILEADQKRIIDFIKKAPPASGEKSAG